jgi:hypothetical protein
MQVFSLSLPISLLLPPYIPSFLGVPPLSEALSLVFHTLPSSDILLGTLGTGELGTQLG